MDTIVFGIAAIVICTLYLWYIGASIKITRETTNSGRFVLVCTPEGYRRVLAQCEIAKITPTEYFNRAIDLMSDDLKLPRPDDKVVI